jgi:hypothetical protein
MVVGTGVALWWFPDGLREMARTRGVDGVPVTPWENPAIGVPVLVAAGSATALLLFARVPRRAWQTALLLACLAIDLGSYGWFLGWRYLSPPRAILVRPDGLRRYADEAAAAQSRVYVHGMPEVNGTAPIPNLNQLWDIPSANGYTSLILGRYDQVLPLPWEDPAVLRGESAVLDLLAVRHLFVEHRQQAGFAWGPADNVTLGAGHRLVERWPTRARATHVAIVGALSDSTALPDHAPVAELRIVTAAGDTVRRTLRAGDDFSEWAYDRPDVRPVMRHARAPIFRSFAVPTAEQGPFFGHSHLAVVDLGAAVDLEHIELEWTGPSGALWVRNLSTRDAASGATSAAPARLADHDRWQWVENIGAVQVYRNLRHLPRAWLVSQVLTLTPAQIKAAITTSRLPGGDPFDPRTTALVEEPVDALPGHASGTAAVVRADENRVELATHADAAAFLVLSDAAYPGWQASIDGRPVPVYRTDYLLRGVLVPPGQHRVQFVFRPLSLAVGGGVSAATACGLVAYLAWPRRRARHAGAAPG